MKKALILIDIQNDFLPMGALPVSNGDEVIPVANRLADHFDLVAASKDWHPADHKSFAANHPWRKPGQIINLHGLDQILWPIHCVQDSFGAEFPAALDETKITKIFLKGSNPDIDSYSAFFDNARRRATGLGDYLKSKDVETIFLVGLATDYCVKFTAIDALELGFEVFVVVDGVRGINIEEGDEERALTEIEQKGGHLIRSDEILAFIED